jgi:hypothetical protein
MIFASEKDLLEWMLDEESQIKAAQAVLQTLDGMTIRDAMEVLYTCESTLRQAIARTCSTKSVFDTVDALEACQNGQTVYTRGGAK